MDGFACISHAKVIKKALILAAGMPYIGKNTYLRDKKQEPNHFL